MSRLIFNKLVRDKIPDIIRARGQACEIELLDEAAYRQALAEKLREEVGELLSAPPEAVIEELADVYEVLAALGAVYQLDPEAVSAKQAEKRAERGGFEGRQKLLWIE